MEGSHWGCPLSPSQGLVLPQGVCSPPRTLARAGTETPKEAATFQSLKAHPSWGNLQVPRIP